jgi:hypothetical protein
MPSNHIGHAVADATHRRGRPTPTAPFRLSKKTLRKLGRSRVRKATLSTREAILAPAADSLVKQGFNRTSMRTPGLSAQSL